MKSFYKGTLQPNFGDLDRTYTPDGTEEGLVRLRMTYLSLGYLTHGDELWQCIVRYGLLSLSQPVVRISKSMPDDTVYM